MNKENLLIEIETIDIKKIEKDLEALTNDYQITEQRNLDGNLPYYVVLFGASLKILVDILDYFIKFDDLVGKIKRIKTEDKTLSNITVKELKELIDYYAEKSKSSITKSEE